MAILTILTILVGFWASGLADTTCNPLLGTCAAIPGMPSATYSIDFTQETALPDKWISADYETTTFGMNGAEFTFNKRYDAPYIWTSFYILFGHVEVVMQAAPGVGIISSAVMLSDDADEIDWEFSGNNFGTSSGKIQTNYFGKGITGNYDRGTQPQSPTPETDFHTYTLDWSATTLTWLVDGEIIRTLSNNNMNSGDYQYPQTPSRLHLGLWDGGDPSNGAGTVSWAGGVTNLSLAPFTAYVKSVKIVPASSCANYLYTDTSGSWQSVECVNVTSKSSTSTGASISSTPMSSSTLASNSTSSSMGVSGTPGSSTTSKPPTNIPYSSLVASSGSSITVSSSPAAQTTWSSKPINLSTTTSISHSSTSSFKASNIVSTTTTTTTPHSLPFPTTISTHKCNQDNCLRNLFNNFLSVPEKVAFCSTYLATASQPIPSHLNMCQMNPSRVSSACLCLPTPTAASIATTTSTGQVHRLGPSFGQGWKRHQGARHKINSFAVN